VCRRALSGGSKSPLPPRVWPNRSTSRTQTLSNRRFHMHPMPANLPARRKPIPIGSYQRLSSRGCIGNAPAVTFHLMPELPLAGALPIQHSCLPTTSENVRTVGAAKRTIPHERPMAGTDPRAPVRSVKLEVMVPHDHSARVASRNRPSLAVARNCGMGSSSLNADVKAFDRLHMVRDSNSGCCGVK
jgi:hypothetical protein